MTLTLYLTPPSAPCRAVHMTAKHLGLNFKVRNVDMVNGEHKKPEFLKMHPFGQVPVIDDNGFIVYESRAIMMYLINKYSPDSSLYPRDPEKRANVDKMLSFDLGNVYKSFSEHCYPQMFEGKGPDPVKEAAFRDSLKKLDKFLEQSKYVAGDTMTLVDLSIFAQLLHAQCLDINFAPFPRICMWMKKLSQDLPYHNEINVKPLADFKKWLESNK